MKGLYVYGALTMAFSFYTGVLTGDGHLMLAALVAAALAALGEALSEVAATAFDVCNTGGRYATAVASNIVAILSWAATAFAGLFAAVTLL